MSHFLNYLNFVADLRNDDYSKFNHTKEVLKDNFQDVESEHLVHMLGVIKDLRILFLSQDFSEVCPLTEYLRERIFTLYEKKTIKEEFLDTLNKTSNIV